MKWIPVKDRLPEVSKMVYEGSKWMQPIGFADYFLLSDWVLVTADADSSDGDDTEIFVAQYEDDLDGRTYWTTIGAGLLNNVTAWMPLPQPYKADRKTDNSSEKPNNCEDLQDWKDRMWAEAIVTEPTTEDCSMVDKDINVRSKDEPQITMDCSKCRLFTDGGEECDLCALGIIDEPQTESTGSPIGDYRDGVGAWQTDCGWK